MANAEQIKALLQSHLEGNEEWFYATAMQMAAQAARQGQGRVADDIRKLIDTAKEQGKVRKAEQNLLPIAQPRGELSGLLSIADPKTRLSDLVLPPESRKRLERVVKEQRQGAKLRGHGLTPRHKLLLVGPPGSGKTMTAAALAGEMNLPLFTILLDGLITKFMGETAAKMRLVFDAIKKNRGVYLFDEVDAIGGHRATGNDVGEIRRVLNSFLQFLEQDDSNSLIIAATNHPELLDKALFRRFDDVLEYTLPDDEFAEQAFRGRLGVFDTTEVNWSVVTQEARGLSYAEIKRVCEDAAKETVLRDTRLVSTAVLLEAIQERKSFSR